MHPPFSPRGENGPCTVQKTRQEGDFGLPLLDHPFKRHKEGAAAPSLETPPSGAAAGREAGRFDKHPRNLRKRDNLRHERGLKGAFQRTWMRRGKIAESWLSTVRIPKLARTGKFGRSGFFFHRARRILFRQDEKEWGVHCPAIIMALTSPARYGRY